MRTIEIQCDDDRVADELMEWFQEYVESEFYDWIVNSIVADDIEDLSFEYDFDNLIIRIESQ